MIRCLAALVPAVAFARPLAGTAPLEESGDFALRMVEGIHRYLDPLTNLHMRQGPGAPLARTLGIVEPRVRPVTMELVGSYSQPSLIHKGPGYHIQAVRWEAIQGLYGEGLLLQPESPPKAPSDRLSRRPQRYPSGSRGCR
ncbi:MAG: hypothetical protein SFV51_27865 [Bryobacteraceae bacterium]|nr:hypothetical protein [Bryobacteraceae bacterium]